MGLDVYAHIIVGVPIKEIYIDELKKSYDVVKTDKNGTKYTVEEEIPIFVFMGKEYRQDGKIEGCDLIEKYGLVEINDQIMGIEIKSTDSHRDTDEGVTIELEDLNIKINDAMKKLESWGLKGKIYLIQRLSY